MNRQEESAIKSVWDRYWSQFEQAETWDTLSATILDVLLSELQPVSGSKVLEAGSGTGRISHELALAGAKVTCLDISESALDLAKDVFGSTPAEFVQGSILSLPLAENYELVWNAGVLEHFAPDDQRKALTEFLRVLHPNGKVLVFTPYAGSLLYRGAKLVLEAIRRWPYGTEIPEWTLAHLIPEQGTLEREYTVSFLPMLIDAYKFLPFLRLPLRRLARLLLSHRFRALFLRCDRYLSRLLGGYLLVSVISNRA